MVKKNTKNMKKSGRGVVEIDVKVNEIGKGKEKMRKLRLKLMENYVKESVNCENIVFV
ncbi:MAG: hypothetical protein ABIH92_04395 [Nanoarchaeota archaeon]